jgi:hypothetical protein
VAMKVGNGDGGDERDRRRRVLGWREGRRGPGEIEASAATLSCYGMAVEPR